VSCIVALVDSVRWCEDDEAEEDEGKEEEPGCVEKALRLERFLNTTGFFFFALILFCLIILTPADAIYQFGESIRLVALVDSVRWCEDDEAEEDEGKEEEPGSASWLRSAKSHPSVMQLAHGKPWQSDLSAFSTQPG
jgi:hypothetical protein